MFKSYPLKNHQMNIPEDDIFLKGTKIIQYPVKNTPEAEHFDERIYKDTKKPTEIDQLVIHCSFEPDIERVIKKKNFVGAHYVVHTDGTILQCIDESKRAYHAGVSSWANVLGGDDNINAHSIGIEVENPTFGSGTDYTKEQIDSLIKLCKSIIARHHIKPENVIGHSDVAPTRKADPGVLFPWRKLAEAGIGIYPKLTESPKGIKETDPRKLLEIIGYKTKTKIVKKDKNTGEETVEIRDDLPAALRSFKRHFMPFRVQGEKPTAEQLTIRKKEEPQKTTAEILKDLNNDFMLEYENNVKESLEKQPAPSKAEIKRMQVVANAFQKARSKNR